MQDELKTKIQNINSALKKFKVKFDYKLSDNDVSYPCVVLESKFTRTLYPFNSLQDMTDGRIAVAIAGLLGNFLERAITELLKAEK